MARTKVIYRQPRMEALSPLRAALEREGRSIAWLARLLDIPRHRLWSYFYGDARIPRDVLERACLTLHISAQDIISRAPGKVLLQQRSDGRGRPGSRKAGKHGNPTDDQPGNDTRDPSKSRRTASTKRNFSNDASNGGETRAALDGGHPGRGVAESLPGAGGGQGADARGALAAHRE